MFSLQFTYFHLGWMFAVISIKLFSLNSWDTFLILIAHLCSFMTVSCGLYHTKSLKIYLCLFEDFDCLRRFLPRCTYVFFLPSTLSFPQFLALRAFFSVSIIPFIPTLLPLPFLRPPIYVYIFLSLLLLTPSPLICLLIYPHPSVPLYHH